MSIKESGEQMKEAIEELKFNLIEGLTTDGAHHKQYYLEFALLELVGTEMLEELRREHNWEEGVP